MISNRMLANAQLSDVLDASRNGTTGGRDRRAASIRLPPETWEKLKRASKLLGAVFPEKYVTVNSTVEFLLEGSLDSLFSPEDFSSTEE